MVVCIVVNDAVVGQRGVPRQAVDLVVVQSFILVGRIVYGLVVALNRPYRDALDLMIEQFKLRSVQA